MAIAPPLLGLPFAPTRKVKGIVRVHIGSDELRKLCAWADRCRAPAPDCGPGVLRVRDIPIILRDRPNDCLNDYGGLDRVGGIFLNLTLTQDMYG